LELYDPTLVRAVREAEIAVDIRLLQLEQAEYGRSDAEIAIATARLRQATIARQIAEEEYDEVADDKGAATSAEALALANAKVNYEIARAEFERAVQGATETQIDLLRAQLEQAELGLEAAETRLSYAQMEAPFEGTVLALNTDVGDMVFARNPILTLADLSKLQVIAQVDEIDIAEIAVGQEVEIVLDAFPAHTLKGLVVDIAPAATPQRGSTVYATTIAFNASELDIRSGMSTNLIIITKEKEDVLLIPNRAIEHIGQADVVQVLEEGEIREQAVELGLSNRQQTEVISGLEAGEIVVVE
jgi:HlyD family secretion protein